MSRCKEKVLVALRRHGGEPGDMHVYLLRSQRWSDGDAVEDEPMPSTLRWAHLENLRSACASGLDFDEVSLKKDDCLRRGVARTRLSQA